MLLGQGLEEEVTGTESRSHCAALQPSTRDGPECCSCHIPASSPSLEHPLQPHLLCRAAWHRDSRGVLDEGLLQSVRGPQQWLGIGARLRAATLGSPPTPALFRPPPLLASPRGWLLYPILQLQSALQRGRGGMAPGTAPLPPHAPALPAATGRGTQPDPAGAPLTS